ncbi:MAG: ATP-binding protein [Promethearchaeota archaeon]
MKHDNKKDNFRDNTDVPDMEYIINGSLDLRNLIDFLNDNFFFLNEKKEIIFSNTDRSFLNKSFLSIIYEDDIKQVELVLDNKDLNEKKREGNEVRVLDKEKKWIWNDFKAKTYYDKKGLLKHLVILQNISDKKITEEKYQSLFENSPNAILLLDFTGKIIDINSTVIKIFGNNKDHYVDKPILEFQELYPPEIKSYFKQVFKASFFGDFPDPIEAEFHPTKEKPFWAILQASLVKFKDNTVIEIIFQDITEKKKREFLEKEFTEKLEIEVKKRTEELKKALEEQKLYLDQIVRSSQVKSEFMATMSHELRTPLNAIIGFTDLLMEGAYGDLSEDQLETLNDIKSSAEHEFEMIKKILNISEIEAGKITLHKKKFSIGNIVNQVISSLKPLYSDKDINIKIKGLEEEMMLYADPIRFKEIMINLIDNSLKFTEEGEVTIVIQDKIDRWIFKVKDTGIGIASKDHDIVFKEFQRIDSTYVRSLPGTGLGLSLTRRLIHLHGGDISFSSMLGVGTTFTFHLPKELPEEMQDIL